MLALAAGCLMLLAGPAAAAASSLGASHGSIVKASAARLLPPKLSLAAARSAAAERRFISTARSLKRCIITNSDRPARCSATREALQHAAVRLRVAQAAFSAIAKHGVKRGRAHAAWLSPRSAPHIYIVNDTLRWPQVDGMETYVLVRSVSGGSDQYAMIHGHSTTPPPVPGTTVYYSVRTSAANSAWAPEVSIVYPASVAQREAADKQTAPVLTSSGDTLNWHAVAGLQTYVFVAKAPGKADEYSVVSGTSITPPAVPGATVRYSVRTAVEGSAWATEAAVSYPTAPVETPPVIEPVEVESFHPSQIQTGVVSGSYANDYPAVTTLGAKFVRLPYNVYETTAQLEPAISQYAAEGVRVLLLATFDGTMPTPAEARNLATWAARFGPGGTFWEGRSDGSLAIQSIEFGNETSYSYQYPDDTQAGYAARAQSYARSFVEADEAIHAANPSVGLLAQGDAGNAGPVWVENMFKAEPNLGQYVAGWTIHPYGPNLRSRVDSMISETAAQGAPATIPIDITEFGISSENGQCVNQNFGWPVCMTYQQAGEALTRSYGEFKEILNGRSGMFVLYTDKDWHAAGASNEAEAYFGALQSSLAPKGAYTTAVQTLLSENS